MTCFASSRSQPLLSRALSIRARENASLWLTGMDQPFPFVVKVPAILAMGIIVIVGRAALAVVFLLVELIAGFQQFHHRHPAADRASFVFPFRLRLDLEF